MLFQNSITKIKVESANEKGERGAKKAKQAEQGGRKEQLQHPLTTHHKDRNPTCHKEQWKDDA
jgi:hypothetical protein